MNYNKFYNIISKQTKNIDIKKFYNNISNYESPKHNYDHLNLIKCYINISNYLIEHPIIKKDEKLHTLLVRNNYIYPYLIKNEIINNKDIKLYIKSYIFLNKIFYKKS
jgi:hypothetical protein